MALALLCAMSLPSAEITIRPPAPGRYERPFGVATPGDTDDWSLGDVASALNPLHYIPFVSQVYEAVTGDKGAAPMKLVGGALLGGPVGFLANLAEVIFEQETGKSVVGAVASALTGDEEKPIQVASIAPPAAASLPSATLQAAQAQAEILPPLPVSAHAPRGATQVSTAPATREAEILDLFGGGQASAHRSYQKAQMLPYLQDVSRSLVL